MLFLWQAFFSQQSEGEIVLFKNFRRQYICSAETGNRDHQTLLFEYQKPPKTINDVTGSSYTIHTIVRRLVLTVHSDVKIHSDKTQNCMTKGMTPPLCRTTFQQLQVR